MGRILEALSRGEARDQPPGEAAPTLRPGPAEPDREENVGEGVPFIEVGGPRKIIDASPDVLACVPAPRATAFAPAAPAPTPAAPGPAEPGLKAVRFRPLTADPLPPAQRRLDPELTAFHQPAHALSEGYRVLLASLAGRGHRDRPCVLLFTAPAPRAGTTTVLLNLAITAAREGVGRVLVVDANRRRPAVARRLGLPAAPGLREVLAGGAALPQALQETGLDNLCALAAGRAEADGAVRLVAEALPMVLRLLREQFRMIFVDAPSAPDGAEAAALAPACDAAYVVVEQSGADAPETAELLRRLRHEGSPVCGCVLTQWRAAG